MRVVVIGTGHVGLLTAATFSRSVTTWSASTTDDEKIEPAPHGITPFFEPGLSELIDQGASAGTLRFMVGRAVPCLVRRLCSSVSAHPRKPPVRPASSPSSARLGRSPAT